MSSGQLRSKGASNGQSLPERTRKTKTSTNQPDQQTMDQQSSPQPEQPSKPGSAQQPAGESAASTTSPAPRVESMPLHTTGLPQMPAVQVGLLSRTSSPQVQLPVTQTSSSHISPMSGPLFTEDRLSTSGSDQMCDQEVTTLTQDRTPTRTPVHTAPSQSGSITTVDYSTQGDLDQPAHSPMRGIGNQSNSIDNTRNFLLPDGTGRRIVDIPISERKPFILDNGHSAYQIQLKNLEPVLETSTYLIDRFTSQFHMVYDDGYQQIATMPMIWSPWEEGQLVAKLNETHTCFGLPPTNTPVKKPAVHQQVPAVVIQRSQSHLQQVALEDIAVPELTNQPPHPRIVEYLEPSFSLERPVCRLKMDERLEVHNNFISAISNKMHKVDLIHRLKKSEPHNSAHYQEQLNQQLTRHDDVIHRLMDIMKTDDYFRQTEDLPPIDPLTVHEEIAKFSELFDVHEAVSRVATEVDILERYM